MTGKESAPWIIKRFTAIKTAAGNPTAGFRTFGPMPPTEVVTWSNPSPLGVEGARLPTAIAQDVRGPANTAPPIYRVPATGSQISDGRGTMPNPPAQIRIHPSITNEGGAAATRTMAQSIHAVFKGTALSNSQAREPRTGQVLRNNYQIGPVFMGGVYGPSARGSNSAHPEAPVFTSGGGQPQYIRVTGMDKLTKHL